MEPKITIQPSNPDIYILSSLLSTREYSDDRKYAFVHRLHGLPILTGHCLGDAVRHLLISRFFP